MVRKYNWCVASTTKLIEMYEADEALYNVRHPEYKNRLRRLESYKNIISCDIRPGCSADDVKKKINGLRTSYSHEKAKVRIGISLPFYYRKAKVPQPGHRGGRECLISRAQKVEVNEVHQHSKKCLSMKCRLNKNLLSHAMSHSSSIKSGLPQEEGRAQQMLQQTSLWRPSGH
ncbi:uncharacterized protein LOC124595024 [Schistocerca americana]|uniref:uncharacterized protein LOC124595024 n=1 Tax=Schistocerca americana TaxID=7009 RepID=UPI001F4F236A|nr:uncharacterized protein LOC124595024 [Schistocerca americana]